MTGRDEITIIGAGPVGSLLGLYLARRGFGVTIYEQRPDMRRTEIPAGRSINLALAARGIHALDRVGLMDRVRPQLIAMRGRMIHDEAGHLELQPYGRRPDEVIFAAARGELNRILMSAAEDAGVVIRFDRRCASYDPDRGALALADETTGETLDIHCDVVIGADGSGSAVRRAIADQTSGTVAEEPLGHSYKELTIPPGPGGTFRMEQHALHIWPRGAYMLIALPNPDGSFTATLFLPNVGPNSFATLRTSGDVEALFGRHFADAVPLITELAESFFAHPTGRLGTVRCRPWHYRGHGLVIGDAAHAIVPFHGQGMNAGFEDCVALDACIGRHGGDWDRVFAAFDDERKPNADAIADMALENYVEMRDSVRDPRFLLKKELAWRLEDLFPERFTPRYAMVMFHLLPYAEVQQRGRLQAEILEELTASARSVDDVDFTRAARLIDEKGL